MEEAAELADYLPLSFKTPKEQEYIKFLWDAFEINYTHDEYQFAFLAYSPLAFGWLTGKYLADPNARGRITLFPGFGQRYNKPNVPAATREYARIAKEAGLTPATMALAFARTRWFARSVLLGATSVQQLRENLDSAETVLSAEVLEKIEAVHGLYPNPAP
ncbi:MAG: aldo/keto reductase [Nitrosomonadales bacterium]|nr:aldo/keto reductase [Nitrosomonadales bacterium]